MNEVRWYAIRATEGAAWTVIRLRADEDVRRQCYVYSPFRNRHEAWHYARRRNAERMEVAA